MRKFLLLLLLALILGLPIFALSLLDDQPLVADTGPPTPEDVFVTKELVHEIREATSEDAAPGTRVRISIEDANRGLKLGTRLLQGFRAHAWQRQGRIEGEASIPVPLPWGRKWLNVEAILPAFEGEVRLDALRVGGLKLPPGPSISAGRIGANLLFGGNAGDKILSAASAMEVDGEEMVFTMALTRDSRGDVMRGVFGTLRGGDMPTENDIDRDFIRIRDAIEDGTLSDTGSFLPHIRFALDLALNGDPAESLENRYTAAIFALTKACGAWGFSVVVGGLAGEAAEDLGSWTRDCTQVTFRDRIDSRRHFITSAALQAASNRGFAVSVGEFKELHDTISGAGGFDFTDLAANLSGIALSDFMMTHGADDWPGLIARLTQEDDVIASYDGIPGLMPEEEFQARFDAVDSPAYVKMLRRIETRIDALALYR